MLAMLPSNIGYPESLSKHFKTVFKNVATKVKILSHKELKKKGLNLLLSVGDSARNKHHPLMMVIERNANIKNPKATVCLIGKGITFDSGGINIKSGYHSRIEDMKFDKIGAIYAAYAMLDLIQDHELDGYNFVAILPFAENAVSDKASMPGDVIKGYSGKTVEINNTDAEGRLILADSLAYACDIYKPNLIVDIATLTGFAEIMSCGHSGYYFTENEKIKKDTEQLSFNLGERMIPMMTWNDMGSVIKSDVADLLNVSRKNCNDAFVAAIFLKEFVTCPKTDWLHIDLSHETDDHVPEGNGIRTMTGVIRKYLGKE
jgi:leucyl aminopeptidase